MAIASTSSPDAPNATDADTWQQPRAFEDSDVLLLQQEHHLQQQQQQQHQQQGGHDGSSQSAHAIEQDLEHGTPDGSQREKVRRNGTLHLTADERLRVRTLYFDGGRTKKEISRITGYSSSQVRTAIRQPIPKRRPGRPRKDGTSPTAVAIAAAVAAAAAARSTGPRARRAPMSLWEAGQTMAVPMAMAQQALNHGAGVRASQEDHDESSEDDLESDDEEEREGVGLAGTNANSSKQQPGTSAQRGRPPKTQEVVPLPIIHDSTKTIVLVTNASSGIGHAIASGLCLAYCPSITARPSSGGPYHVFLADRDYVHASNAARSLTCHHSNTVSPLQLDTRHPQSVMNAARFIHETIGRIDVLVLNNNDHERSDHGGRPPPGDPVSILRDMLETNLVSSYAVSEGLKWLLMAQPRPETLGMGASPGHKDKRLIHVTSLLSSITLRQCQIRPTPAPHLGAQTENGQSDSATAASMPPPFPTPHIPGPPLPEYRMALAAINMLAACQAAAAQAAGVRVGVWNSNVLPQPPMPPELAPGSGPETPTTGGDGGAVERTERTSKRQRWRKQNAGGPGISQEQVLEAGKACVKVINGERDGDFGGLMDTFQGWVPW